MPNTWTYTNVKRDSLQAIKSHVLFAGFITNAAYTTNSALVNNNNCIDLFDHDTGLFDTSWTKDSSTTWSNTTLRFAVIMDCRLEDLDPDYAFLSLNNIGTTNVYNPPYGFNRYPNGDQTSRNVMTSANMFEVTANYVTSQHIFPVNGRSINGVTVNEYYAYNPNIVLTYSSSGNTNYSYSYALVIGNKQNYVDMEFIDGSGGGGTAVLISKTVTANGVYDAIDDGADGYSSVTVAVPIPSQQTPFRTVISQLNNINISPDFTGGSIASGAYTFVATPASGYQWETGGDYPVINISGISYPFTRNTSTNRIECVITQLNIEAGTPDQQGFVNLVITGGDVEPIPAVTYNMYWMAYGQTTVSWGDMFDDPLPATLVGGSIYTHVFSYDPLWILDVLEFDYVGLDDDGIDIYIDTENCTCTLVIDVDTFIQNYARTVPGVGSNVVYYELNRHAAPAVDDNIIYHVWLPTDENLQDINDAVFINYSSHQPADVIENFISLKRFWCNPPINGQAVFTAGEYEFTRIVCPYTNATRMSVTCGAIEIPEEYHDIRDYAPYANAQIYLPFIGFEGLDINVIMGKTLTLTYMIDLLGGSCLATLIVLDGEDSYLYAQWAGDMSIDLPIRVNDGYKGTYDILKTNMLGDATPAILIEYNETLGEKGVQGYYGSNSVSISTLSGFVRFKDIDVTGINATKDELDMIKKYLTQGIIV